MDNFPHNNWRRVQYDAVAQLVGAFNPDGFLMLGDGQHNWGTLEEYQAY